MLNLTLVSGKSGVKGPFGAAMGMNAFGQMGGDGVLFTKFRVASE